MDKKTIAATALSTASAGGGGYLIYHAATSGSTEVQTVSEPSKKVEDSKKPTPATDEKVAPPKAKPANSVPAAAPKVVPSPQNTGPKPGSIKHKTDENYENEAAGTVFGDVLLAKNAEQSKWDIKNKKLKESNPESKLFLSAKTGVNADVKKVSNTCGEMYTYKRAEWKNPKPSSGWDETEYKKLWNDTWTYCSLEEQTDKPEEWPFKNG